MANVGHSRLLKFFVTSNMSENPKIFTESVEIESDVPKEQEIRKDMSEPQDKTRTLNDENNAIATKDDFTLSPVITVTKKQATLTKGDLKLQKVTVTEDISAKSSISTITSVSSDINEKIILETQSEISEDSKNFKQKEMENAINSETGEDLANVKKVSKIPRLRFRAAVNKVRKEQRSENQTYGKEAKQINKRRSSIPRLKEKKVSTQNVEINVETEAETEEVSFLSDKSIAKVTDEEFEKIYEEIVKKSEVSDASLNVMNVKDPEKLETKFDEIIHAYDENKIEPINLEKVKSRIPLLKRKSEHDFEFIKNNNKALYRKSSLGRIPIANTLKERNSKTETRVPHNSNNNKYERSNSKIKEPDTTSNGDTSVNLKVVDSQTIKNHEELVSVTTDTKISSDVVSNHSIHETCTSHSENKGTLIDRTSPNSDITVPDMKTSNTLSEISNNTDTNILIGLKDVEFSEKSRIDYSQPQSIVVSRFVTENNTEISSESNVVTENKTITVHADTEVSESRKTDNILNSIDIIRKQNEINESYSGCYSNNKKEEDNIKNFEPSNSKIDSTINIASNNADKIYSVIKTTEDNQNIHTELNGSASAKEENEAKDLHHFILNKTKYENDKSSFHHEVYQNGEIKVLSSTNIKESEVIFKYKPEIKEFEVTKDKIVLENLIKPANYNNNERNKFNQTEHKVKQFKSIKASQTVDKRNEEDIIILKGKVNRVISRLDSIEPNKNKKMLDDLPKQSNNDPKPVLITNLSDKSKKLPSKDDKPKIVDVLLKEKSEKSFYQKDYKSSHSNQEGKNKINEDVNNDKVKIAHYLEEELVFWRNQKNKNFYQFSELDDKDTNKDNNNFNVTNNSNNCVNIIEDSSAKNRNTNDENDVFARKSADIINAYKTSQLQKNINIDLDMKKAKSLVELDLGDAVTGKVRNMACKMKSVDKLELRREVIDSREKPRKGSVSERIALFEGRPSPARQETEVAPPLPTTSPAAQTQDQIDRIAELVNARVKYGQFKNMTYVEMGSEEVPAIWVGTAQLEPSLTRQIVRTAIELGYRAFDTAYIYGTEAEVGAAIQDKILDGTVKREDLFIASKLWSTFHRTDLVEKACRQSLETMGLDYFDLFMIHNPMSFKEGPDPIPRIAHVLQYSAHDYMDAWFGVEGVVRKGLARRAGVSNFNTKQLQRILDKGKMKPVVNQVESHPYLNQLSLDNFCRGHNVKLSVFGALGSKGTPAEWKSGLTPVIDDPLVKLMAAGLGITPAQLLISYQLMLGRSVVVKSSCGERLWENLQALSIRLLPEHISALNSLNKNRRIFTFKGHVGLDCALIHLSKMNK